MFLAEVPTEQKRELSRKLRQMGDQFSNVTLLGAEKEGVRVKNSSIVGVDTRRYAASLLILRSIISAPQSYALAISYQSALTSSFPDRQPHIVKPDPYSEQALSTTQTVSSHPTYITRLASWVYRSISKSFLCSETTSITPGGKCCQLVSFINAITASTYYSPD